MQCFFWALVVILQLSSPALGRSPATAPVQDDKAPTLDAFETSVRDRILSHVNMKTGSIAYYPIGTRRNIVHPWFAFSAAVALLESGPSYHVGSVAT